MSYFEDYENNRYHTMLRNNSTSTTILSEVVEKPWLESTLLMRVYNHANATPTIHSKIIEKCTQKNLEGNLRSIASMQNLLSHLIDRLIETYSTVRRTLAAYQDLTPEQEEVLFQKDEQSVLVQLAGRTKNPETQIRLYNMEEYEIMCNLTWNSNLSIELQNLLKNHSSANVRYNLANNSSTCKEVLEYMANNDSHSEVKRCARRNYQDRF